MAEPMATENSKLRMETCMKVTGTRSNGGKLGHDCSGGNRFEKFYARTAHKDKEPMSETRSPGNWRSSGRLGIVSKIPISMASRNSAHTQRQRLSRKKISAQQGKEKHFESHVIFWTIFKLDSTTRCDTPYQTHEDGSTYIGQWLQALCRDGEMTSRFSVQKLMWLE